MTMNEKIGVIAAAGEKFFHTLRDENKYSYNEIHDIEHVWYKLMETIEEKIANGSFYT